MRKKYFFLLFILFINPLYAGDISIEFIAPDVDGKMKPLRDCRDHYISPDGLVVRDYLSGLTLEGAREERLLNRINRVEWETGVPSASLDTAEGEDLGDDFDDLDEELGLKKEKVRLVDPLYEKDQDVLPESFRLDKMSFDLDDGAYIINPGNLRFEIRDGKVKSNDPRIQIKAKRVIVTLMPIRFSVLYDGKKVNFKPELKFQKRDLMSEIRSFRDEYVLGSSPFLPKADGIVRQVYDLTLYLVPDTNYTFMGKEFSLGKKGIKSHDKTLGKRADYWLTWTTKKIKESIAKRVIPLSFMNSQQGKRCNVFHRPNVNAEISTDRKRLYVNAKEVMKQRIAANYSANTGEKPYPVSIIFLNPDYDQYPGRLLCFRNITGDPVVGMTLFSFKPEISKGQHEIRIETDAAGSDKLKGINQISAVVGGLGQSAELKWTTGSRTIRLIRKKKTNKWTFDTKELPQNFTLRFPELTDPGIWSELPFVKSAGLKGSLTIFANRGRRNYELGESIDLSLSIRGDADKSAVNWKLSHKGKVIWQKKDLQHLSIDSSSLSAGHYHMSAELSGYASYAFSFSLYTSEPYSDYPSAAIRPFSIVVPDKSISPLRHFFLADSGMASMSSPAKLHETVRGGRLHPGFAELLIASPLLPDLERTQLLTPYERSLEIATAEGARVYSATELKESYDSYNIPHTVVVDEKRMFRRMQHMVQRRRAYKSFGGLTPYWHAPTYGYREGSPQIYGHDKKRRDLIRELYEKKMKTPVPDKVPGILNNHYNGHKKLPLKKLKALNKERYGWELHQAELMASTYANWNRGIKAIGPYPLMMDNYSYWAITNTNYAPLVYSKDRLSLDWILSYNITDFGHMPFDTIYGTAISSLGADPRRPILTHAWSWGRQVMLEGLLAMSQGADCVDPAGGMGLVRNFGTFNETQQSSAGVSLWDRKMVGELFNRYGRMMGRLKPTNNVAIYMSMKQQWGPGNSHADRVWLFYRDLIRHRQIPALISDAELTIETLKKYKAVFLLGLNRPLDAEERKVLEAYKASGGRIFKDEDCPANLPGEKMAIWEKDFPKGKSAIRRMNMRAWLDHNGEKEFVAVHKRYLKIESELSRVFKMMDTGLITTDSYRTLLGQMTGDTVTLAVLLNKRLLPSEVKGHWRQLRNLPDNAVFNCAADSHVYDLFSGKKLQGKKAGKSQSFEIRFNQLEAALLLMLPSPVAELKVGIKASGNDCLITAAVQMENGKVIEDAIPYQIKINGDKGNLLFRSLKPGESLRLRSVRGKKIELCELISGLSYTKILGDADLQPLIKTKLGPLIYDSDAVQRFAKRKGPVMIVLDEAQQEYKAIANSIKQLCENVGRKTKVVLIDASQIRPWPMRWYPTTKDQGLFKKIDAGLIAQRINLRTRLEMAKGGGDRPTFIFPSSGFYEAGPRFLIPHDAILFGDASENRFLKEALELTPRQASKSFPGKGRLLLQYAWSPFASDKDALIISGDKLAVNKLEKTLSSIWNKAIEKRAPVAFAPLFESYEKGGVTTDTSTKREILPNLKKDFFGHPITALATSPNGKYFAVSAKLWGDNLFVFDASGKLLWKRHLGELGSADLTLTKDAQRLFAKLATRTYCFDKTGKMLFQLESPGNGIAATGFKLGDHLLYIDSAQQRIYQAGQLELRCLDFNGKVLWRYDDIPNCTEKMDFYLRRGSLVKAVSKDYVLVNFFGIKKSIFDTFVDYWKPELMLLSATDGKVIWRKKNMPLNFGQALIIAKKVVVYTESGDLQIYDPKGKLLKILRPGPGIDTMKAVPGKFAIIASALVTKDVGKIPLNHSKLLYMIDLENGNLQNISEKHEIADFAVGAGILLSDWSGQIVMTDFSAKKLWSTVNPGSAKLAFLKDGVLCATSLGKLYLRDIANGKIRKTIDLNAYNYPGNSGKDIQRIKGEAALMQTDAGKLQSAITPGNGIVDISKTLLKDGTWPGVPVFKDPSAGNCLKIIDKAIETEINCEPNNSYLIQLHLRMEKSRKPLLPYRFNIRSTSLERLVVEVRAGKKLIYQVSLAGSDSWVERQLAFKSGEYKKLTLRIYQEWYVDFPRGQEESKKVSLSKRKVTAAMLIAGLQCRKLKYGTDNLLANKAKLGVKMIIPNPMQHLIHKVNHKPRLPWMTFFDGKISDQQTSWLRSNSAGITDLPLADVGQGGWNHATLEVSLGTTRKLSAIAVYEDPLMPRKIDKSWCGRLLRTQKTLDYAVLVHDVDLGKWVPVGAVQKNENYFNLFTFKSRNVDKIAWFWTKGDDWHIRLSEIEAYGNEDDIPEFDDLEADDDDDEIEF